VADQTKNRSDDPEAEEIEPSRRGRSLPDIPRPVLIGGAVLVAVAIGLIVRGTSSDTSEADTTTTTESTYRDTTRDLSIAAQLPLDPQYTQYLALASASGWLQQLGGEAEFTVFIPDTAAFATMPPEELAALTADPYGAGRSFVERYIVQGKVAYVQLLAGQVATLTSVDGASLAVAVDGSTVTIGGAKVTKHDISAANGVIHVLDSMIEAPAG
jgi:uncharacterized surface protein with fasciclin (FAS1) repeats